MQIQAKISEVRESLEGQDVSKIEQLTGELQMTIQKVGEAVYSAASTPQEDSDASDSSDEPPADATVEGEYREEGDSSDESQKNS